MRANNGELDFRRPETRTTVLGDLQRPAILDAEQEQKLLQVLALRAEQTRGTIRRANGQVDLGTVASEQFAAVIGRKKITDEECLSLNAFAQEAFRKIAVVVRDGVRQTTGPEL